MFNSREHIFSFPVLLRNNFLMISQIWFLLPEQMIEYQEVISYIGKVSKSWRIVTSSTEQPPRKNNTDQRGEKAINKDIKTAG